MTTKTLSTYAAGGYVLAPAYSELDITKTGGVGGNGVYTGHFATISNFGTINSTTTIGVAIGILFGPTSGGGVVINRAGGYIGGYDAVFSDAGLSLVNYGTIDGYHTAVEANSGGTLRNGNYLHKDATIGGSNIIFGAAAASTIANYGTIAVDLILMEDGGTITNGGAGDPTALITGAGGVYMFGALAGTVRNFGILQAAASGNGVNLGSGGQVTNGAVTDTAARIEGGSGVLLNAAGAVSNFGTIAGTGAFIGGFGAVLGAGGQVSNGTSLDRTALIEGYTGVQIGVAAGTVTNFGTIEGQGVGTFCYGVYLRAGGSVTNGGGADHAALIEGSDGVVMKGGASATVKNFGTILATGAKGDGVLMSQGSLTNGSLNNAAARIDGYYGAFLEGSSVSANFGTITGSGGGGGAGVALNLGASLVNGAAGHSQATISGFVGARAGSNFGTASTLTNFGTIAGAGGTAVYFESGAFCTLVVEAGCAFTGAVLGGEGTLDLDTGVGTVSGLFASGGVTVSGSMAPTTFQNFYTLAIGPGANFTSSGAVNIGSVDRVTDAGVLTLGTTTTTVVSAGVIETTGSGSLTIKGPLSNTGTISADGGTLLVKGAVTGSGQATLDGGVLDLASTFTENVTFTGTAGTLELAQSQTYTGTVTGFTKSGGTFLDLLDIAFGGATTASYAGNKKGGTLTVTDGTHTAHIALKGNYLSSTFIVASDGQGGTLVHDPAAPAPAPASAGRFAAAMAGWAGGGAGVPGYAVREPWRAAGSSLTAPRMHFA